MFRNLKSTLIRPLKFGLVLLMSFSLINGMEDKKDVMCNKGIKYSWMGKYRRYIGSSDIAKCSKSVMRKIMNIIRIKNKMDRNRIKKRGVVTATYKLSKGVNNINIFGSDFVENNNDNFKIYVNGKWRELSRKFNVNVVNADSNSLVVILVYKDGMIDKVTDLSYMFYGCEVLSNVKFFNTFNTSNVTNMSNMFYWCKILSNIKFPDVFIVSNVTNMSGMFNGCSSLISLPDISKWDTSNVTDMSNMFYECSSLISLPDISKWDTNNVTNMIWMFGWCSSLSLLPDISKWNTSKVKYMGYMFNGCKSLTSLPDISKWNIRNVADMDCMFTGCKSLSFLPDISKLDISNVEDMWDMFLGCSQLLISKEVQKKFDEQCL